MEIPLALAIREAGWCDRSSWLKRPNFFNGPFFFFLVSEVTVGDEIQNEAWGVQNLREHACRDVVCTLASTAEPVEYRSST